MHTLRAVLFDYGMVLSGPPNTEAWQRLLQLSGLDDADFHRVYWQHRDAYDDGSLSGDAYWQQVAQTGGFTLDADRLAGLHAADLTLWTDRNEPMIAWAHMVQSAGRVRTGILSNIGDAMAAGIREKFDWMGRFDHAVWSHALKTRKPDPAIYRAAADGLGVPAETVLFIDDRAENIRGAEAVGMQGILYGDHEEFLREIHIRGLDWLAGKTA